MSEWEELDQYLYLLTQEIGGVYYILSDAGRWKLSPRRKLGKATQNRFQRAFLDLQMEYGDDFLRRGRAKRHFQVSGDNLFVAEPLLNAYLLIVIFNKEINEMKAQSVLDRNNPALCRMISGLPPIDGGGKRILQVLDVPESS